MHAKSLKVMMDATQFIFEKIFYNISPLNWINSVDLTKLPLVILQITAQCSFVFEMFLLDSGIVQLLFMWRELKIQVKEQLCLISFHHLIAQVTNLQFLKFQFNQILFAAIYLTMKVANQKALANFFLRTVLFLTSLYNSVPLPLKCIY